MPFSGYIKIFSALFSGNIDPLRYETPDFRFRLRGLFFGGPKVLSNCNRRK